MMVAIDTKYPWDIYLNTFHAPIILVRSWNGGVTHQSMASFAFAMFTYLNLIPRALSHHRWHQHKFEDYPRGRKAVIPWIIWFVSNKLLLVSNCFSQAGFWFLLFIKIEQIWLAYFYPNILRHNLNLIIFISNILLNIFIIKWLPYLDIRVKMFIIF